MVSYTRFLAKKRGNIILITAAISVLLVGIIALVTDIGYVYLKHADLQTATNAAWKAGYDKMAELRKLHNDLTDEDFTIIKNHMLEVMAANGYTDSSEELIRISLINNKTNLKIDTNDEVNLFFMKIFGVNTANVASNRSGSTESYAILPVAIPHGEVHDLTWKTYDWIPFRGDEGFASGTEYILKLGETDQDEPVGEEQFMIYIPTGLWGGQSDDSCTKLAYGAAFWALKIDDFDTEDLTPAYWLLSNNGGGFLTRYNQEYERVLMDYFSGVTFYILNSDQIIALLKQVNITVPEKRLLNVYLTKLATGDLKSELVIPLVWRPKIAIYSSQSNPDPVETELRKAKIPYGTYGLPKNSENPNGWDRNSNYNVNKNDKFFDIEILNNELDKYDWIHLHHEEFTGLTYSDGSKYNEGSFSTKCSKVIPYCFKKISIGAYCESYNSPEEAKNNLLKNACPVCRNEMNIAVTSGRRKVNDVWVDYYHADLRSWKKDENEMKDICSWKQLTRCGTCGYLDLNNLSRQESFKGCKFYNYLHDTFGFTDDVEVPYCFTNSDVNLSFQEQCVKWFTHATAYQKMKWAVCEKIKEHILKGGFMFTQCFAAETLDLALQQSEYYRTKDAENSYNNCIAFKGFKYLKKPSQFAYSSIDKPYARGKGEIANEYILNPLCQVSGIPYSNSGATSGFRKAYIKDYVHKFSTFRSSSYSDACQYIGGKVINDQGQEKGHFAMVGGHSINNVNAARFVLNNVMLGSTSDKATSIGIMLPGKTKYQYGCIDPDNDGNKTSMDYIQRLLYGYNSPINFADIISTDNSRYTLETQEGTGILTGSVSLASYTPNTIVIVPIICVPDSVKQYQSTLQKPSDNPVATEDITIYDLKVGESNYGAADYDNLNSNTSPSEISLGDLKNSVQILGFAKFRIMSPDEYTRSDVLGEAYGGQIRGEFLGYIVDPRETISLLSQYNN